MSHKALTLLVFVLMWIQGFIIIFISKKNQEIFDQFGTRGYFQAIEKLTKVKPLSGWTIRGLYLLTLLEYLIVWYIVKG